ncbi:unnamed protein product [Taenia asiatica]|uniref:Tctex1 domain-containing protein 1 n=1 Tax=Taenia asiatica TaxID=60517 RepID=A0A0R3W0N9_TAEAS|nr:unnamed protein product [Taenia asiatica]
MASKAMLVCSEANGQTNDVSKPDAENGLFRTITPRSTHGTYQLEPDIKFPRVIVAKIVKEVVDSLLLGREYEPGFCRQASRLITDVLKTRVKLLQLKRYRIIAQAIISNVGDPNFYSSSLCLWEPALDTCVSYEFCNGSIVAAVSVFGIYQS